MVSYQPAKDLNRSAQLTYVNMRPYYERYSVDWDHEKILEQTLDLDNWDILYDGKYAGIIRLAFDSENCYLRDLQVSEDLQNRGIGAHALEKSRQLALTSGANKLKLRVFKISPAFYLYKRNGFAVDLEDEKFYYMEKKIS